MTKLDRRRKYYMVLDCETATLPCVGELEGEARKKRQSQSPSYTILDGRLLTPMVKFTTRNIT